MSTIPIHRAEFLTFPRLGFSNHRKFQRITASWKMAMDSKSSSYTRKKEELLVEIPKPSIPQLESSTPSDLRFDRLQPSDKELVQEKRFQFGQFVAREAVLDEEYWTAAWLRAETHWENRTNERYVDNFKRKFADQEFNVIKSRCRGPPGQKYTCIVTVKKEVRNAKRTVLKSVVGTLDLNIRYLLHGETFPGERVKAPLFCSSNRYGYVANLCVAKSARRQGIARNMLHFAIESAKSDGVEQVYVHVHRSNMPAQELYQKMGFEMVEEASSQLLEDQTYLLCVKT
ncbi:GCN5-related N-acetyltransferase 6, chloroplastic [Corylus avellana]|uniref:GCN5-related N-acetyltransferase 6, chloroplastic n=1 Tax=Corylus avellana TaxID=13451 RepID=UPI00286C19BD|nr:GCN5-related N-acetyltransferase 6, chloroplastic [Corylus avellana]